MNRHRRLHDAILGSLISDAAAMGLHWLYKRECLALATDVAAGPAFLPVDPEHYANGGGYLAHAGRRVGDPSQYGDAVLFWLDACVVEGATDWTRLQQAFLEHFGPGGRFTGYADRPTRHTVSALLAAGNDDLPIDSAHPDDDQNPALESLLAALAINEPAEHLVGITHASDEVQLVAGAVHAAIDSMLDGQSLSSALNQLVEALPVRYQETVEKLTTCAANDGALNFAALEQHASIACHLPDSVPFAIHLLNNTTSFRQVVEANITLGGDSCGRAMTLGPLAGIAYGRYGIPAKWLMQLNEHERLAMLFSALERREAASM